MRIEKEEKRSLKKLFVGILVMALLVTMLPFEQMGQIVAKAADETVTEADKKTSSLQSVAPFSAETPVVWIESVVLEGNSGTIPAGQRFQEELYNIVVTIQSKGEDAYPNGVILKLGEDVDLENFPVDNFFVGNIGIDLNGYSITNMNLSEKPSIIEGTNETSLFIYSAIEGSVFSFMQLESDVLMNAEWYIYSGQKLVFDGVDVQNVNIFVEPGAGFGFNEHVYDLSMPDDMSSVEERVYFYADQGLFYVENDYKSEMQQPTFYVEELFLDEDSPKTFDVYIDPSGGGDRMYYHYEYSQAAVDALKAQGMKLLYDNYMFSVEYEVPDVPFTVDDQYGIYSVSDDNTTMTIYGAGAQIGKLYDNDDLYVEVYGPYTRILESEDGSTEIPYDKVIFAEGAIPETVNYIGNLDNPEKRELLEVYLDGGMENTYEFHLTNRSPIPVVNVSYAPVTVVDEDLDTSSISKLWVLCEGLTANTEMMVGDVPSGGGITSASGTFIEAGSKVTITPNDTENGTIYDVLFTRDTVDTWENVTYKTDGSVEITIPNYSSVFACSVGTMEETTSYSVADLDGNTEVFTEKTNDTVVYGYMSPFVVSPSEGYLIAEPSNDDWSNKVTISQEGNTVKKTFYIINQQTMVDEQDIDNDSETTETIPVEEYGKISKFTYVYSLDLSTPTIDKVVATDKSGNVLDKLTGSWQKGSAIALPEIVWTTQPQVTLTATGNNGGSGFEIAGYKFGSAEWQAGNTNTYTGDGKYEVQIHVRDGFDAQLENLGKAPREEAGVWVMHFGIDTTAPTIEFTDAKTTTSTALKNDSEHEGNLHVKGVDATSGVAAINLFKKNGTDWVAANETLISTPIGYYIAPTTQNEIYRFEITDVAGNKTVYDNITVVGYRQDVITEIGKLSTVYGEELEIPVTIHNISENKLEITIFALREAATDAIFGKEIESVTELEAGESFTTTLRVPKGTDAGSYAAMIDMTYINVGTASTQHVTKVLSQQITAEVQKAAGKAAAVVDDYYFGESLVTTISSTTNGTGNVAYYYKLANADDSTYSKTMPTAVGNYKVKAVFAATTNYKEVVVVDDFAITRLVASTDMYSVPAPTGENQTYKEPVVIRGENGNLLSLSENGTFRESLTIDASVQGYTFYVKTPSGAISKAVVLPDVVIAVPQNPVDEPQDVENQEPADDQEEEEIDATSITAGSVHLERGVPYEFGTGTWMISGDSTVYVGGMTFYIQTSGDYEISQAQTNTGEED